LFRQAIGRGADVKQSSKAHGMCATPSKMRRRIRSLYIKVHTQICGTECQGTALWNMNNSN